MNVGMLIEALQKLDECAEVMWRTPDGTLEGVRVDAGATDDSNTVILHQPSYSGD